MSKATLEGRSAWLISDGRTGSDAQSIGIAEALGLSYDIKAVAPRGMRRLFAPWLAPAPSYKIGTADSMFCAPWPALVMAASRQSIPFLRAVKKAANGQTYAVVLLDPRTGPNIADVIWVPEHDRLRAQNVITSVTTPHAFSPERISALRAHVPSSLANLPRPLVMLALGGANKIYHYTPGAISRFKQSITSFASLGASFLIANSRRTPAPLLEAAKEATKASPRAFWEKDSDNSYPNFLAHADILVVTADSISMTSEACATGRPVYVFEPDGGSEKFSRFHKALQHRGITKPLPPLVEDIDIWQYPPVYSTYDIASKIEQRWLAWLKDR